MTDFEQTPLHRVFEMVRREAERHGCTIVSSEIVGLAPRKALEMAAAYFLKLEPPDPLPVFEDRLAKAVATAESAEGILAQRSGSLLNAKLEET